MHRLWEDAASDPVAIAFARRASLFIGRWERGVPVQKVNLPLNISRIKASSMGETLNNDEGFRGQPESDCSSLVCGVGVCGSLRPTC